jgi:hypothetical protein
MGDALQLSASPMHTNQRCAQARVSDYSIMRDVTMETRDLRVSIFRAGASRLCLSHVVAIDWGERNKQWSEIIFGVTPYTTKPDTSDMSDNLRLDNLS